MSNEVEVKLTEIKQEVEERRVQMTELVRRVALAAVGAVAMSKDEIEQFIDRLVERGELAEREGKQMVRELVDRRKRQVETTEEKVENGVESRVEQILAKLNIPTKRDIEELSDKIGMLTARIEELKKSRG